MHKSQAQQYYVKSCFQICNYSRLQWHTTDTSQMSYMWIQQQAKCSSLEVDHDMLAGHTLDLVQMMLSKKKSLAMNATQLTYSAVE